MLDEMLKEHISETLKAFESIKTALTALSERQEYQQGLINAFMEDFVIACDGFDAEIKKLKGAE